MRAVEPLDPDLHRHARPDSRPAGWHSGRDRVSRHQLERCAADDDLVCCNARSVAGNVTSHRKLRALTFFLCVSVVASFVTAVSTASEAKACHSRGCRPHRHSSGRVFWRGNYETGNFSQWWLKQWSGPGGDSTPAEVGPSAATIVRSPVAQGRYAAKFQDFPDATGTNDRAEIVATQRESGGYPGQEWYYGWHTYFPGPKQKWWSQAGDWNAITQFQSTDDSGGWINLGVDATTAHKAHPPYIYLDAPTGHYTLTHLRYRHWYHFVLRVRWSANPSSGFFQFWLDGAKKIRLTRTETLKPTTTPGMYLSQGIYRDRFNFTNTVIQDGMCRASSYAAAARC